MAHHMGSPKLATFETMNTGGTAPHCPQHIVLVIRVGSTQMNEVWHYKGADGKTLVQPKMRQNFGTYTNYQIKITSTIDRIMGTDANSAHETIQSWWGPPKMMESHERINNKRHGGGRQ